MAILQNEKLFLMKMCGEFGELWWVGGLATGPGRLFFPSPSALTSFVRPPSQEINPNPADTITLFQAEIFVILKSTYFSKCQTVET